MAAELAGLLLPFLGVVRRLLVVEARILGLDGGEAQLNGLVEEITKGLKPKGEKEKECKTSETLGDWKLCKCDARSEPNYHSYNYTQ